MPNIIWLYGVSVLLIYIVVKYIYRLTFHPLAKFPGPKLAAATNFYGASFDLLSSESYVKSFPAFHEKYGLLFVASWGSILSNSRSHHSPMAERATLRRYGHV